MPPRVGREVINTPRPIRSQAEILAERYATSPRGRYEEEEKKHLEGIALRNALPRKARKKARKERHRDLYEMCKMKRELLTDQYPFSCKEAYYAKYAYNSAVNSILANPNVPQTQKNQTAHWHQLPYYTRDAYIELIKQTFALRDDIRTKEKKLWAAQRHIT